MSKATDIEEAYMNFANAIIIKACEDYRESYPKVMAGTARQVTEDLAKDCEDFFKSEWFMQLTDLDGEMIMNLIRSQSKPKKRKYTYHG